MSLFITIRIKPHSDILSSQLWSMVKQSQMKHSSQDPDSLEDVENSLMECDPQEKLEFADEKLFKVTCGNFCQYRDKKFIS